MLPIIFSFGPVRLYTILLFTIMAFLTGGYVFWRKSREEHYNEEEFFDSFLLSILVGFIVGRLSFILLHFGQFEFNLFRWIDFYSAPGINGFWAVAGSTIYLFRYAQKKKWDVYQTLDFWSLSVMSMLAIVWLGLLFDGSGYGNATRLPWGIVFPGVFDKHHPTQLYATIFYGLLLVYTSKLEYKYRTFEWYKAKRKSAQTGFLFALFLISQGFFQVVLSFLSPHQYVFSGMSFDALIGIAVAMIGVSVLFFRSGRELHLPNLFSKANPV